MTKVRNTNKPDHWSDINGNPDDWDVKNIRRLINNFYKRRFSIEGQVIDGKTYIKMCVDEAKYIQDAESTFNKFNVKSDELESRCLYTMPPELNQEILEAYPTLSRVKEHVFWFWKNFPEFRVAQKI